jgi:hypothetical protein
VCCMCVVYVVYMCVWYVYIMWYMYICVCVCMYMSGMWECGPHSLWCNSLILFCGRIQPPKTRKTNEWSHGQNKFYLRMVKKKNKICGMAVPRFITPVQGTR